MTTMVYDTYRYSIHGVYKPTLKLGGLIVLYGQSIYNRAES